MIKSNCKHFPQADIWCSVCGDQERKLPSGESITLTRPHGNLFVVECWDKDSNSRWHKEFAKLSNAMIEFHRFG